MPLILNLLNSFSLLNFACNLIYSFSTRCNGSVISGFTTASTMFAGQFFSGCKDKSQIELLWFAIRSSISCDGKDFSMGCSKWNKKFWNLSMIRGILIKNQLNLRFEMIFQLMRIIGDLIRFITSYYLSSNDGIYGYIRRYFRLDCFELLLILILRKSHFGFEIILISVRRQQRTQNKSDFTFYLS